MQVYTTYLAGLDIWQVSIPVLCSMSVFLIRLVGWMQRAARPHEDEVSARAVRTKNDGASGRCALFLVRRRQLGPADHRARQ